MFGILYLKIYNFSMSSLHRDLKNGRVDTVLGMACKMIGTPYCKRSFNCYHFVKTVYEKSGLALPWPPEKFALHPPFSSEDHGKILYLIRKGKNPNQHGFTHCGIISETGLIHCSGFVNCGGKKVTRTCWEIIWRFYTPLML